MSVSTTITITNIINNNSNSSSNNNINIINSCSSNNNNIIIKKKLNVLSYEEELFFKVFHNIVILKEIFRNIRRLEDNDTCRISSLREFYDHPNREYISNIIFDNSFNEKIPRNLFKSSTIQSITFGSHYNHSIKQSRFASELKEINMGYSFNKSLSKNSIPTSVTSLSFHHNFNQELIPNQSIPNGLKKLVLGYSFNKVIQYNSLPMSITDLEFGHSFNNILSKDILPKGLKILTLGACWDHPLKDINNNSILPDSITSLKFYAFSHPIHCYQTKKSLLPSNLKKLIFVQKFNCYLIIGSLPSSIEYLDLGYHFSQPIERGVLSSKLKYLNLGNNFFYPIDKMGLIPNQLEYIQFPKCSFQKIVPHVFPQTLHTVSVGYYFKDLDQIPSWVKVVECSKSIPNIPKSIKTIRFKDLDFSLNSINLIPDHITTIETGDIFNQSIKSNIPASITSIKFGLSYNSPIDLSNSNIKHLQFECKHYTHHLTQDLLPSNLQTITISKYNNKKYFNNISKSIKIIII